MYLNKVLIYGNLTRDPELKALPSGAQVCTFGVATNRVYKKPDGSKQEDVEFHNITVFGTQANVAAQYLKKGRPVFIEGRLRTTSWDKDGSKHYRTEIIAERFQFGPSAGARAEGGAPAATRDDFAQKAPKEDAIDYPAEDINPDDIPF